jgi:hypothetical protein
VRTLKSLLELVDGVIPPRADHTRVEFLVVLSILVLDVVPIRLEGYPAIEEALPIDLPVLMLIEVVDDYL